MKKHFSFFFAFCFLLFIDTYAEPLYSPTWGFKFDLPEAYEFIDGNGKDRFSFKGPAETYVDIVVYADNYSSVQKLAEDVSIRLKNSGEISYFTYNEKKAAIIELMFDNFTGWGLCIELEKNNTEILPILLAISYGDPEIENVNLFHFSALDSIAPSVSELHSPGPVTEFIYPQDNLIQIPIKGTDLKAWFYDNDAEAAQALIDREFTILKYYQSAPNWQEAWLRFYRAIYKDSYERLRDAAFQFERSLSSKQKINMKRDFAYKALSFVQKFSYERNLSGSDFVNLVSAITEGRGDCDSRAMLWAIILNQANIEAAMMVSRQHSHAMGLALVEGEGARFKANKKKWLVAETTTDVDIGRIAQEQSEIEAWTGVIFE
jgi:hypothetical protein